MNVEQVMKLAAVIPVIRIDRLEDAVPMAAPWSLAACPRSK